MRIIPKGGPKAPPLQKVTVYVGKIAETVDDTFVKTLLEQCGRVVKWNRVLAPTTNKPKSFGFCQFAEPSGALRCLRLLKDLDIDGKQLLVSHIFYFPLSVDHTFHHSEKLRSTPVLIPRIRLALFALLVFFYFIVLYFCSNCPV